MLAERTWVRASWALRLPATKGWDLCAGSDSIGFLRFGGGAATSGAE